MNIWIQHLSIFLFEKKYFCLFLFLLFAGCNQNSVPNNLSDIEISYIPVKDINASLITEINQSIAVCYRKNRWDPEEDTIYLARCKDSAFCLKTNIKPIQEVNEWSIIEFKNMGKDKLILLGNSAGYIFSAKYSFQDSFKLFHSDFRFDHISRNSFYEDIMPCPIELLPNQSYYNIDESKCWDEKCKKHPSMNQFIYYKPNIDSVYRYWFIRSEMKITDNALELLEKTKNNLSAERYHVYSPMFRDSYKDTKRIFQEDSLVKSWIND